MLANNNKFHDEDYLFPPVAESSRLLVGCNIEDYSASRIARAVEDCNAHLLNLNVTSAGKYYAGKIVSDYDEDYSAIEFPLVVDLRVSHRNTQSISRSLERYGYTVIDTYADNMADEESSRRNINHLLRYLEI